VTETPLIVLPIVVRFSDCDPLGHVNNATYSTYLEQARLTLWRHQVPSWTLGAPKDGGPRQGFILARTEIDFRSQAHEGDVLDVRLWLDGFGTKSATYRYEIVHAASGRLVADAKTVQVWFDYDANATLAIDDELRAKLSRGAPSGSGLD